MLQKFVFVTLTFNHQKFIIEHLESIKYQILNYATSIKIKLIIADDCSSDLTIKYVKAWCEVNSKLFDEIIIKDQDINIGTCKNYTNIWKEIDSKYFKITAGDDIYSFENVFRISQFSINYDIVSTHPLFIVNSNILLNKIYSLALIASNSIYKNFYNRIRNVHVLNPPSLFYNSKILTNQEIFTFVRSYNLIEDLPLQLKMSEIFKPLSFHHTDEIYIYYRRTSNSAYIVKNYLFELDKSMLFEYMIRNESKVINKILLSNMRFCYKKTNIIVRYVLNINYYKFLILFLFNFFPFLKSCFLFDTKFEKHKEYYNYIKNCAQSFIEKNIKIS